MKLQGKRILLTGAASSLGCDLSRALASKGARLVLIGRTEASVASLEHLIAKQAMDAIALQADLTEPASRCHAVQRAMDLHGGVDILINLANTLDAGPFNEQEADMIPRLLSVNLEAPMQMSREVLPAMIGSGRGHIVNIGSMLGSIGYPGFATYSASKCALRGFSQALHRELAGSGVMVTYVAPRRVRASVNPDAALDMTAGELIHMEERAWIAARIVRAIERDKGEAYLGFPENLFARVNALLPRVLNRLLRKAARSAAPCVRGLP